MTIRHFLAHAALAAALAAALLSAAAPAFAEDAPAQPARPAPSWGASCESASRNAPLSCAMEQRAFISGSGQLVAAMSVRVPGDTRKPVLLIRLPLGLSIEAGVTVSVDGADGSKFPLQTCDASGCYASAALPEALGTALARGQTVDLIFAGLDKRPLKVSLPLTGFAAAYASIK